MLGDIKSKPLLIAKGGLFAVCLAISAGLLFCSNPSLQTALLITVLIWSSARLYYFLFYVLEKYVDPRLKYAGLWSMVRAIVKRNGTE